MKVDSCFHRISIYFLFFPIADSFCQCVCYGVRPVYMALFCLEIYQFQVIKFSHDMAHRLMGRIPATLDQADSPLGPLIRRALLSQEHRSA